MVGAICGCSDFRVCRGLWIMTSQVDDLQRELKLETSDAMQDSLQSPQPETW